MSYDKQQFEKNYPLFIEDIVNTLNLIRKGDKSAPYRIETIFKAIEISKKSLEDEIKNDILLRKKFERIYEYKREFENLSEKTQ